MRALTRTVKSWFDFSINANDVLLRLFGLLLLTDLAFIIIHVVYRLIENRDTFWSIYNDFGYSEIYQYIKEFWIVALLLLLAFKSKKLIYYSWAMLFLYILLDDSLRIHESMGEQLVSVLDLQPGFGLRAKDFGEVIVSFFSGTILFSIIGLFYLNSDLRSKQISRHLLILMICLVFFGLFFDMIHSWISIEAIGIIEDGGEMIIMSMITCYVFSLELMAKVKE